MERTISQAERIRRAEEIYNRRRYENGHNNYSTNNTKIHNNRTSIKCRMIRKMLVQILVCTAIYLVIYIMRNSNQIFSDEMINKAKEILSYDVSVQNLYEKSREYFSGAEEKINQIINKNEEDNQDVNNVEENYIEGNNIVENIAQEAVGGAEEIAPVEEKSQEELDIEYVKQNSNIIWPLRGVITSRFGSRTPTEIVTANHYGIDIAGNIGDDIVCAMDGTVTTSSGEGDYGNHIRVESGEITTLYAHCSQLFVKEGDVVKQGEKIAQVGQTGRATGPHLHFEIKRENRFINPEEILETMWGIYANKNKFKNFLVFNYIYNNKANKDICNINDICVYTWTSAYNNGNPFRI